MILARFLWGGALLRGELQKYAKKSSFKTFESTPYSTSVSMPLIFNAIFEFLGQFAIRCIWAFPSKHGHDPRKINFISELNFYSQVIANTCMVPDINLFTLSCIIF